MQISRARENRSPGMNHDRHAIRLRPFINRRQAAISVHVVIRRKHLVRRMHLDGANSEFCEAVHLRARIGNRPGEHAAESDEAIRSRAAIFCAPVIHFWSEPNNLWRDVVDQSSALYS